MSDTRMWTVTIAFTEDDTNTRADAFLDVGPNRYQAWGRARRNPADPDLRRVGEEIAAARALERLVNALLGEAEHDIESFEGHTVHVHA